MYRFYIDTSELKATIRNFQHVDEIDVLKEVNWYLNQVYRDLSRRHGTRYSYVTPPGSNRKNLRVRSRRLLNWLRDSRFVNKQGNTYNAGWNIGTGDPKGNYLGVHVGMEEGETFKLTPAIAKYTYSYKGRKRILIPLRAGLRSDGAPIPITGRMGGNLRIFPARVLMDMSNINWNGEDTSKFHDNSLIICKSTGRKLVPMYILARQATIPKRILLVPAMEKYVDKFYDRIESQIDKALNGVTKRRNR